MKCPVCSYIATRNFDHQRVYWFCHHCWQEIPKFDTLQSPRTLSSLVKQDPLMEQLKSRIQQQRQELVTPHH